MTFENPVNKISSLSKTSRLGNPDSIVDNYFEEIENDEIDKISNVIAGYQYKNKLRNLWRVQRFCQGIETLESTKVKEKQLMDRKIKMKEYKMQKYSGLIMTKSSPRQKTMQ